MRQFDLSIAVARANPALLRTIRIQETYTAEDLVFLACLSLGLEPTEGTLEWNEEPVLPEQPLSAFLVEGNGRILLSSPQAKKSREGLVLFLDLLSSSKGPSQDALPTVLTARGGNLPADRTDMAEINRIRSLLTRQSVVLEGGSSYSAAALEYSEKRVANAIARAYAPELAAAEVNHALALPLLQLLAGFRVTELKEICSYVGVYPPSPARKADLIAELCRRCDRRFIEQCFEVMPLGEYLNFRAFVLRDDASRYPGELSALLPTLCSCGLASSGSGPRIAREVLEYYESWFDSSLAEQFLQRKYTSAALDVSRKIYGIFSREMYRSVLNALSPVPLKDSLTESFFRTSDATGRGKGLALLADGVLFSTKDLTRREANAIWAHRPSGMPWFIPTAEIALQLGSGAELSLSPELRMEILELICSCSCYTYRPPEDPYFLELYDELLHLVHTGIEPERICRTTYEKAGWRISTANREKFLRMLQPLVVRAQREIPLVILAGFTAGNCPPEFFSALQSASASEPINPRQQSLWRKRR